MVEAERGGGVSLVLLTKYNAAMAGPGRPAGAGAALARSPAGALRRLDASGGAGPGAPAGPLARLRRCRHRSELSSRARRAARRAGHPGAGSTARSAMRGSARSSRRPWRPGRGGCSRRGSTATTRSPRTICARMQAAAAGWRGFIHAPLGYRVCGDRVLRARERSGPFLGFVEEPAPAPGTVFQVPHSEAASRGPVRELAGRPAWVQVVHGGNLANAFTGWPATGAALLSDMGLDGLRGRKLDGRLGLPERARAVVGQVRQELGWHCANGLRARSGPKEPPREGVLAIDRSQRGLDRAGGACGGVSARGSGPGAGRGLRVSRRRGRVRARGRGDCGAAARGRDSRRRG